MGEIDDMLRRLGARPGDGPASVHTVGGPALPQPSIATFLHMACAWQVGDLSMMPGAIGAEADENARMLAFNMPGTLGQQEQHLFFFDRIGWERFVSSMIGGSPEIALDAVETVLAERRKAFEEIRERDEAAPLQIDGDPED